MAPPEALKNPVADAGVGLRAGIGRRFPNFGHRIDGRFRQRPRTVETSVRPDVRGLLQAGTKNMERMEETIPEADPPCRVKSQRPEKRVNSGEPSARSDTCPRSPGNSAAAGDRAYAARSPCSAVPTAPRRVEQVPGGRRA